MKPVLLRITILSIILSSLQGCYSLGKGIYGMKDIRPLNDRQILHYANKYNIPTKDCFKLDTSFLSYLVSSDSLFDVSTIKNHYQPLQALYFNQKGEPLSFQVNCYAGGFPNLKWNRNNNMSSFPPEQQAPLDTVLNLDAQLKFLQAMSTSKPIEPTEHDYYVFVYWSRFMGRQSKRFIRIIRENSQLDREKSVRLIYVNTDEFFASIGT